MEKLSEKLDYNISDPFARIDHINKIIEEHDEMLVDYYDNHYNPHLNQMGTLSENTAVCKDLEALATYIINAKYKTVGSRITEDKEIISDHKKKRNKNREVSLSNNLKVKHVRKETNKSIFKKAKIKVSEKDRSKYIELKRTGQTIKGLTSMIQSGLTNDKKRLLEKEIKRLKWIRTDIQKDEVAMKNELVGYIRFQKLNKEERDHNQLSYIRFDDTEVIRVLLDDYAELKEMSYDDTFGYLKLIMHVLDELIERTEFKPYIKDVLIWKIEKLSHDEIIERLINKHNMRVSKPVLSQLTRDKIPQMIVNTYKQAKEDWVYTYKLYGKYKTCKGCKTNYLASNKYFSPNKKSKSGLRPICKKCRKDYYKKSVVAKKV